MWASRCAGRVPVNLNFTAGREAMASAIEQCGIRTVVTSRAFLAKAKIDALAGHGVTSKTFSRRQQASPNCARYLAARFAPAALLSPGHRTPDSLATVIFSSGSTGVPKGVMLSHYNVMANIEAIAQVFWIGPSDRIVGVLPFFHSFGYTVTIWFPLVAGCGVGLPSQSHRRQRHRRTGPPVQRPRSCSPRRRSAPPTPASAPPRNSPACATCWWAPRNCAQPVAAAFREKFGVELLEGYGCTEMAPVVAVNAPNFERRQGHADRQQARHRGPSAARRRRAHRGSRHLRAAPAQSPKACCW